MTFVTILFLMMKVEASNVQWQPHGTVGTTIAESLQVNLAAAAKLQATLKIMELQTRGPRHLQAATAPQGWLSEDCLSACPAVGPMLQSVNEGMAATSTTPAPGDESSVMLQIMCNGKESLDCLATEDVCQCGADVEDCTEGSFIGEAYKCACACPAIVDSAANGSKCTNKAGVLDCVYADSQSCAAYTGSMFAQRSDGMKLLATTCKRAQLGCEEKDEKLEEGECGNDVKKKFDDAGCGSASEDCCSWHTEIISCLDAECVKMELANDYVQANHEHEDDSPHKKKERKERKEGLAEKLNFIKECKHSGLPMTMEEVQAVADSAVADSADNGGSANTTASPATSSNNQGVLALATAATALALIA